MGSAVFGLVWSSAIGVVSEGVVHIFGPVMVITAVLVLMIKFHSNVRGDGLVERPSDRSSHDLRSCCLAFRVRYSEVYYW